MDLMMTSEEICRHYRLAADKKGDIIVLADLNMTSRDTIRKILEEAGEVVVSRKKTSRKYGTTRGPEIEKRLRKGQSVEHIARNMGMKETSVMDWIRENGKEELLVAEKKQLTAEEEARRMEEKARRLKKEIHRVRKEEVNAGESGRERSLGCTEKERSAEEPKEIGQGQAIRMEPRGVMDRVEAVVSALPGDAEEETRARAFSLCGAIFKEWLMKELGLAGK